MPDTIVFIIVFVVGVILAVGAVYFLVLPNYKRVQDELNASLTMQEEELQTERAKREQINAAYLDAKADLHHTHIRLEEQKAELTKLNEQLTQSFENIANKVVQTSGKLLQTSHEEKLKDMLNPFKDRIASFEKKVEATHLASARDSEALKEQLRSLKELNQHIGEEAKNLTNALKGDKKLQGDWGEHRLERILQAAGLEKEVHYRKQVNLKDDENRNFRPDFIVYLPDDKNIVVDSKVSLVAFEQYFNAASESEAGVWAAKHVKAVKEHITKLSATNYRELLGINSPDYVLMYMPLDAALGLAMTEDSELFEYALSKNIVLVSNHTLLATLKTVSFIWKQDLQNKNALEIARQGGALYDKFAGFVDTLQTVGKRIDGAQQDYEKAMSQLTRGTGNLVRRTEQLKTLGAKTQKQLPDNLLD
ncbi:MAG: DNA recombination protein RmuC [Bacteroidetes bacterium]|jgi:DNA recombination protein RmuC|nr:DNA recombination protein RmuC [Bacteroidota bacterium]